MRRKVVGTGVVLAAALAAAVGLSWAIPNCSEICTWSFCESWCYSWGTSCGNWYLTQINGQSYCHYQCWNGTNGNAICGVAGGSPVFRKPKIEEAPGGGN
ncbi:MAG TPA: hypothetical protein VJS92_14680 [Candidatus Polarisedimenticolaceae bacterium]|nr:hypothetical protein [Candidatus Polarisedimenticolaceae bacterium]